MRPGTLHFESAVTLAPSGARLVHTRNSTHPARNFHFDIGQLETTIDEMAAATLDRDFMDELSAIQKWCRVLSEAEHTAALYAFLQQTTPAQIQFLTATLCTYVP